jgi:chromatin segregation and condensation protein Rec8/ScpA/Scc1 (kleisin family)
VDPTPSAPGDYATVVGRSLKNYVHSPEQRAHFRNASRTYRARKAAELAALVAENKSLHQQVQILSLRNERQAAMINFYSLVTTPCRRCNYVILTAAAQNIPAPPQDLPTTGPESSRPESPRLAFPQQP